MIPKSKHWICPICSGKNHTSRIKCLECETLKPKNITAKYMGGRF